MLFIVALEGDLYRKSIMLFNIWRDWPCKLGLPSPCTPVFLFKSGTLWCSRCPQFSRSIIYHLGWWYYLVIFDHHWFY